MADPTTQDMANKLLVDGFSGDDETTKMLSDPIADTAMMVTLDQLRPYNLNPRVTRNPLFDEIKTSIRQRGLDAPPAITRRPGEPHYIIRNGGNTRLAILRELWAELRDERFFRIACLFRPWPQRGEIIALTGHLAENELHGGLTFIERALGIEKARELYEQESGDGHSLSQSELARRLAADGYPVSQPHISRMQDAVQYLLPAIPNLLYGGLGRPQVEKLAALRKAGLRMWELHAGNTFFENDFQALFQEILMLFDSEPATFSIQRVQDELVGQMAEQLAVDYDTLLLEIENTEHRQQLLSSVVPQSKERTTSELNSAGLRPTADLKTKSQTATTKSPREPLALQSEIAAASNENVALSFTQSPLDSVAEKQIRPTAQIPTSNRLDSIQRLIAKKTGESLSDAADNALRALPLSEDKLYPISDLWLIEPELDSSSALRIPIAQFARDIADEAGVVAAIEVSEFGMGFLCKSSVLSRDELIPLQRILLTVLHDLSMDDQHRHEISHDNVRLAPLLVGNTSEPSIPRLSDASLIKLFRLIRLARRLVDLELPCSVPSSD